MQLHFGKKEFGFFPQTYCLPYDNKLLKRAWEDGGNKQKWIIKPPASARGIGIKVIHKWNQIPRKKSVIVQKKCTYMSNRVDLMLDLISMVKCAIKNKKKHWKIADQFNAYFSYIKIRRCERFMIIILGRPYLINESKFDMRVYVYVSSYDPLRIYVFEDGLARFASCK
ncbi:LOW QUALITY PROTEIN: hypothetical protein AM593_10729, partial [Mytilus galloprovincialis]